MPGGREAASSEALPENGRIILQKEKGETGKSRQKNKVQPGEKGKITSFFTSGRQGILFIGNQTGQRSDKGAQPSDIHACKQGRIVFRKAGEQDGGRNIADALAGKNGHRKLMSGKHCAQKPDNHRQTPHVSDEDKEKYKGCKQSVIGFTYQFTVGKKQYNNNNGKNCLPAYYMKHAAKTQEKQQRICDQGPPPHRLGIREKLLHINLFTRLEEEEKKKQQRGKQRIGKHDPQKTGKAHAGKTVKIKILRVADGGEHTAQVGGNGLQDDNKNHQLFLSCNRENQYGKRDKGDQGDIIGDKHAHKKTQEYKNARKLSCIFCFRQYEYGQLLKKTDFLEAVHHTHQGKKKGEDAEIYIGKVGGIRRNQKCGDHGKDAGYIKYRIFFECGAYFFHGKTFLLQGT